MPVVMVSSLHCPWCELVLRDQLLPRLLSGESPEMVLVVFDLADGQLRDIRLGGKKETIAPSQWAAQHQFRIAPTLVAIGQDARPIGLPLVGYSSRDFYGAYLDDLLRLAQPYWSKARPT